MKPIMSKFVNRADYMEAMVSYQQTELDQSRDTEVRLSQQIAPLLERIAELKDALQFYADCEWGWNGGGDYEPMIMRLPDSLPHTLDCKFAGSVAKAALEEATDD